MYKILNRGGLGCGWGGGLKRRGHKLMVWTVCHKVWVCYYKKGGIWWTGIGLGEGVKRGYMQRDGAQGN